MQAVAETVTTAGDRGPVEAIDHVLPFSAIGDGIGFSQDCQVSANGRLAEIHLFDNFIDCFISGR